MEKRFCSLLLLLFSIHTAFGGSEPRVEDFAGFPREYNEPMDHVPHEHRQKKIIFAAVVLIIAVALYYKSPAIKKRLIELFATEKKALKKREGQKYASCGCSCMQRLGYCPCLKSTGVCNC